MKSNDCVMSSWPSSTGHRVKLKALLWSVVWFPHRCAEPLVTKGRNPACSGEAFLRMRTQNCPDLELKSIREEHSYVWWKVNYDPISINLSTSRTRYCTKCPVSIVFLYRLWPRSHVANANISPGRVRHPLPFVNPQWNVKQIPNSTSLTQMS